MSVEKAMRLRSRIIGVLLKDARIEAGKSKRECAEFLGVSTSTITSYEEGRKFISLPELEALAYLLSVPISRFWERDPELLSEDGPSSLEEALRLRDRIVGTLLRQARLEADMTQEELGELLGCSSSTISAYEYGERPISVVELEVAVQALDRSIDDFMDKGTSLVGKWTREQELYQAFQELPEEVREFVVKPINQSYLEVAVRLSQMSAQELRGIAEGILDITY